MFSQPLAWKHNLTIAACTYWPEIYYDVFLGGQFFKAIDDMHARYGPIVRINPDEVHFDDPDVIDTLFPGASRRTDKPAVVAKRTGTAESMVATMSHDLHRRRRNAVNSFFSTASIRRLEPIMKEHMNKLLLRMEETAGEVIQLHHLFKAYQPDLGRPYFEATELFFSLTHVFGHFTWVADLIQSLPIDFVAVLAPSLRELWSKQSWWVDKVNEIRSSPNPERIKSTIFEGILDSSLPEEDKTNSRLAAEAQLVVFAGEGTTAYTLMAAVYELLANPSDLQKLREELIQAIPDPDEIPSFSQVDSLPYFNAIIQEVIRIHPGVMNRQPRISPDLPIAYRDIRNGQDYVLPPGTLTTMSPLTTHMDPKVFVDPYKFLPQRWIDQPKISRAFLGFSRGSRSCLGMNLARKEMAIVLGSLFRRYDLYRGQGGRTLELVDTDRARDIDPNSDKIIPVPAKGSLGLRVRNYNQKSTISIASISLALSQILFSIIDMSPATEYNNSRAEFGAKALHSDPEGLHGEESYNLDQIVIQEKDANDYPKGATLFIIVLALVLSVFLSALDITIVATAIPKINDEFHDLTKQAWYGSAFFLTSGSFQASWGKAYKFLPLKWTFLSAIMIFEIGSLLCGIAPNSETLIVGRAVAGVGCAGMGTGGYTIIAFLVEPSKRPTYTGIMGFSYCVASVIGPLIGGAITSNTTWRWCFYINLPVGAITVLIILLFFRTPPEIKPIAATWKERFFQADLVGVALIMGALVTYSLAMQYGGQLKTWNSSLVIGLLVGFALILVVFVAWERYSGERAIIVPRLLMQRHVGVGSIFAFFFAGSYYLVIYYLPIYFQSIDGATPIMSGVNTLPFILAATLAVVSAGLFLTKTGLAAPLQLCSAAVGVLGCGFIYTFEVDTSTVFLNVGGGLLINAAGSAFINRTLAVLPTTAPGVDSSVVIATGATQLHTVFTKDQLPGILQAYMAGIKVTFAIALAATCISFVVSLASDWKRLDPEAVKDAGGVA
ncbi:MFS general substrate transporter [Aureobasidium sp. EXF-8845]|nr:MFS general substrate transporter [Aureobasidium sp. EXF-8845]KAI4856355.1 MFS general substrate transporter [Aureobasidium sp. EXF-8846]